MRGRWGYYLGFQACEASRMVRRISNPDIHRSAVARKIVSTVAREIGQLHSGAANIAATAELQHLADGQRQELLQRAIAASYAATQLERQLDSALVGQPIEIREHSRIKDCRAAIAA